MNKLFLFLFGLLFLISCQESSKKENVNQLPEILSNKSKVILEKEGVTFRDLNKNGKLDIYEDAKQPIEERVEDLLSQMNLEEKAGMLFINGVPVSKDSKPDGNVGLEGHAANMPNVVENMNSRKMTHFNIWDMPADPNVFAKWYNNTQLIAEKTNN